MKNKVLIIGLGGIGYRHLQAVLKCETDMDIYAVDISVEAISNAKKYIAENCPNKNVFFYTDINCFCNELFEVTIIATSSKIRKDVLETLMKNGNTLRNVIFEKVLFNNLKDYKNVNTLLRKNKINGFVNCTGRENVSYQKLRERMKDAKYFKIMYRGANWGLACNSIHKIDLIAFLANYIGEDIQFDGSLIENKIYESKREGYIEFYGRFSGRLGKNILFVFECSHDESPLILDIFTDKEIYSIKEGDKIICYDGVNIEIESFEQEYISNTSTTIVDNLLNGKNIFLPTYEESMKYHIPMLEMFMEVQERVTGENNYICDIT